MSPDYGGQNIENSVLLTGSDVQTLPEGEENHKYEKGKPTVTYSVALVMAFLAADNENRQLEDLPQTDFCRLPERLLLSERTKSINEFYKLKITLIVVFVITIQRIFPF